MRRRYRKIAIVLMITFVAWAGYYLFLARDHYRSLYDVPMANGQWARVKLSGSSRKFFGHPHVFSWGGGGQRTQLVAVIEGETHIWRGTDEIPFILNTIDGQLYLVLYLRDNIDPLLEQNRYVPYVWRDDEWVEIPLAEFPMSIAELNIGVDSDKSYLSLTKSFRYYLEEAKRYDLPTR